MKKKALPLAAVLTLLAAHTAGTGGTAQSPRATLPPLPVKERGFPARLAPVVEAEHAFAQYSIDHGMKEAFLRFAAPDGVIFRRGPVNAIEAWTQTNPAPTGLLTWWPVYADVSRAGDLGYTTGPYEFREKPGDAKPAGTGHFFTVWRRQPDGSWKFVLDLGVRHPAPAAPETALRYPPSLRRMNGTPAPAAGAAATLESLLAAERALSGESSEKGARAALLAHADESLRLYRWNSFPLVGREAAVNALKVATEFVTWKPLKADAAASGDMGYAYGAYEVRAKLSEEKPSEQGNYARVWKRERGVWRVVLQVTNPAPPPRE